MPNNADIDLIIPGIALVPDLELKAFFDTEESTNINRILTTFKSQPTYVATYSDNAALRLLRRNTDRHQRSTDIPRTRAEVEGEPGFSSLKKLISTAMLRKWISTYFFIDSAAQAILIDKPYTADLYDSYVAGQPIIECVTNWKNSFNSDTDPLIVHNREPTKIKDREFIYDTEEKIGILLQAAGYTDIERRNLLCTIPIQLYYSNTNKSDKKNLLTKEFEKSLTQYKKYKKTDTFPDLMTSYSYLISRISQQKGINKTKEQLDRLANVHLLFGILGLREPAGWMLENIDIYNYVALADDVSTLKTVLFAFAKPLRSFFMEYVQIAKSEKNPLIFLFRATIPILIMTCFVAFAFSLMVPFAMHAIIEIIMLIPTLYISMVLASSYVDLKNQVFETLLIFWRGSRYEQDAFRTNQRILQGFDNDATLAESVRNYYVSRFIKRDAIISSLSKKFEGGLLTTDEIGYYEVMLQSEARLKMEWYDIHDNNELGIESIKPLVAKRLHQDADDAYQTLDTAGRTYIENLIEELERHLARCQTTENSPEPEIRQAFCAHMRWSIFKPTQSLTHLAKKCATQLETLETIKVVRPIMDARQNMLPACLN